MANYKHRTQSTQRYAGTTAGFYNDFIHLTGIQSNTAVTPSAGFVLQRVVFNTAPASGTVNLVCGTDVIATISAANASKDIPYNVYLYDKLIYSCDVACDVTFIVTKGFAGTA